MTRTKAQKKRARAARQQQINNRRKVVVNVNKVQRRPRRLPVGPGLSTCAAKYLQAIENPFSGITACVPTNFNVPTQKNSIFAKGIFTTGTQGVGAITVNPHWTLYTGFAGNQPTGRAPIIFTTSTFTGTTIPRYDTVGADWASTNSYIGGPTGQFTAAQCKGRLVGCGLRIRNITPMLNRGGMCTLVESPGHTTTIGLSMNELNAYAQSGKGDTNGKWNSVTWHPVDMDEHDFYSASTLYQNETTLEEAGDYPYIKHSLAAMVSAPPSNPQQYEWEVYTVAEYVGSLIISATPNDADPQGMARVQNSANTTANRRPHIGPLEGVVQSEIWKAASQGLSMITSAGITAAAGYAARRIQHSSSIRPPLMIEEID